MKTKILFEMFGLICGFSAIITILFFLISDWGKPIYFLEPYLWIRIPEIIIGFISSLIILLMIREKINETSGLQENKQK